MLGLARTPASSAALLLNLESLATMTIAWLWFRENVDRQLLTGAFAILAGAVLLSGRADPRCLGWARCRYGVSLVLFVLALRHPGTARTGAYFSTAPFIEASLAIALFDEPITIQLLGAAVPMAIGVYLHLAERLDHQHAHKAIEHEHRHVHDKHHQHAHGPGDPSGEPHTHRHRHAPMVHRHPHYPDLHHRHGHAH
jgi:drug/metabolite transporter (DMT)-like permease